MSEKPDKVRLSKARNEEVKRFADMLGVSSADLVDKCLGAVFAMFGGDDRTPLLVAEFRLKQQYAAGAGAKMGDPPAAASATRGLPGSAKKAPGLSKSRGSGLRGESS